MQFYQKIDGFRQKGSQGLLELAQLYKQNPLENLDFHHLPKLYIGFNNASSTLLGCRHKNARGEGIKDGERNWEG